MWECSKASLCQCPDIHWRTGAGNSFYMIESHRPKEQFSEGTKTSETNSVPGRRRWCDIVGSYSPLGLTLDKDKLPALSGVAKRERRLRRGDQYLAGLWRSTLLTDIQWRRCDYPNRIRIPDKWRAPSWSWAAHDGEARMTLDLGQQYCTVLDASVTLAGPDPTGEILDGYLILSGPVIVATVLDLDEGSFPGGTLECNGLGLHFELVCPNASRKNEDKIQIGDSLSCLRMQAGTKQPPHSLANYCLVLRKTLNSGSTERLLTYERVGDLYSKGEAIETWFTMEIQSTTLKIV